MSNKVSLFVLMGLKNDNLSRFKEDIMNVVVVVKDLQWPRLICVMIHMEYDSHTSFNCNLKV